MTNLYPNSGPIRGLLYWLKTSESRRSKPRITYSRCLVTVSWIYRRNGADIDPSSIRNSWERPTGVQYHGTCCWCLQPCKPRQCWHTECCKAMLVAKGSVVDVYKKSLIPLAPCEDCGLVHDQADKDGRWPEIDHRLALSVAWEDRRLGNRNWWHAWTLGNLRWLCGACHRIKTGRDRKLLARLRNRQADLFQVAS